MNRNSYVTERLQGFLYVFDSVCCSEFEDGFELQDGHASPHANGLLLRFCEVMRCNEKFLQFGVIFALIALTRSEKRLACVEHFRSISLLFAEYSIRKSVVDVVYCFFPSVMSSSAILGVEFLWPSEF